MADRTWSVYLAGEEVDRAAQAVARPPEQVVAVLRYAITGKLP